MKSTILVALFLFGLLQCFILIHFYSPIHKSTKHNSVIKIKCDSVEFCSLGNSQAKIFCFNNSHVLNLDIISSNISKIRIEKIIKRKDLFLFRAKIFWKKKWFKTEGIIKTNFKLNGLFLTGRSFYHKKVQIQFCFLFQNHF